MQTEQQRKDYLKYVNKKEPKTPMLVSLLIAFAVGGLVCCIGEGIGELFKWLIPTLDNKQVGMIISACLIFLASFLTGIGVFDVIGYRAGAGTIIPITGFSNSMTSPAMEFKAEGLIFGTCAKMFIVAGPVIVLGLVSSFVIGLIYFIISLF